AGHVGSEPLVRVSVPRARGEGGSLFAALATVVIVSSDPMARMSATPAWTAGPNRPDRPRRLGGRSRGDIVHHTSLSVRRFRAHCPGICDSESRGCDPSPVTWVYG